MADIFYYYAGILFLVLAKAKNILKGYSPKTFDLSEIRRCVEYDINVVDSWISSLQAYIHCEPCLKGLNILELGPGSDLGVGLYLLSKGALKYSAFDVNNLAKLVPYSFYEAFFEELKHRHKNVNITEIEDTLKKSLKGEPSQLNYIVKDDFDLVSTFGKNTIDIVFSQAAFEHFDDINKTIAQMSDICKSGAFFVAEVDLKTHSRWIRDKDPNNIYRFSDRFYNIFRFRGIPNRMRPYRYKDALERCGWKDILIIPRNVAHEKKHISGLCKRFSDDINQMNILTITICAKKE